MVVHRVLRWSAHLNRGRVGAGWADFPAGVLFWTMAARRPIAVAPAASGGRHHGPPGPPQQQQGHAGIQHVPSDAVDEGRAVVASDIEDRP